MLGRKVGITQVTYKTINNYNVYNIYVLLYLISYSIYIRCDLLEKYYHGSVIFCRKLQLRKDIYKI